MGNYSCTLAITTTTSCRVVVPTSEIRTISKGAATSAAELMLEFPGHFVSSAASLRVGRSFAALSADEDLEPGSAYVMFPMSRLGSAVAAADLAPVLKLVGKRQVVVPTSSVAPMPDVSGEPLIGRRSLCRSRRPVLETIMEETTCAC